ncbi:MAG: hypothetical protein DRP58_02865 [Spirochaetes bacterium]|nr:MAG: hypothetical protein DRP58_02865 [Spirochaetota bacterium]
MKKIVIIYSIFIILVLYLLEQILLTPYIIKTIIKIPIFTLFPYIIQHYFIKEKFLVKIKKSERGSVLLWAVFVFIIILLIAFAVKSSINTDAISQDFTDRMMLNRKSMIIAALYTIFFNSLIEEYFFRGFIFKNLLKSNLLVSAYIISSSAFAIYHVSIFKAWFSPGLMLLMLMGLFIGGLIFAYFAKKEKSILAPWIIHISADLALILFGVFELGILG